MTQNPRNVDQQILEIVTIILTLDSISNIFCMFLFSFQVRLRELSSTQALLFVLFLMVSADKRMSRLCKLFGFSPKGKKYRGERRNYRVCTRCGANTAIQSLLLRYKLTTIVFSQQQPACHKILLIFIFFIYNLPEHFPLCLWTLPERSKTMGCFMYIF